VISITDNLHTSLSSLVTHFTSFLRTRDIPALLEEVRDPNLREMEVNKDLNQPYVQVQYNIFFKLNGAKTAKEQT